MLVLSRKTDEQILVGDNITITVRRISGNRVVLGIKAPDDVRILRQELQPVVDSFRDCPPVAPKLVEETHGEMFILDGAAI